MPEKENSVAQRLAVRRFDRNPIIVASMSETIGDNINGPSLIRVPDWVRNPLGKYYLYFAHHQGAFIRMAYADHLEGPWTIHEPGVLTLEESLFEGHIASPDVHVLDDQQEIRMYYHGLQTRRPPTGQLTRCALSGDGLHFVAQPDVIGLFYWRAFYYRGFWYVLEMPGTFLRSRSGLGDFEKGPTLFTQDMRHAAVQCHGDQLTVFYSNAHDCPERILVSTVDMKPDWHQWQAHPPATLLSPDMPWEGADCPLEPSKRGAVHHRARQLRDPCVFEEDGRTYLLYSVAGEAGIAMAEVTS